jgi:HSP20 family molecular chaperone IbpA
MTKNAQGPAAAASLIVVHSAKTVPRPVSHPAQGNPGMPQDPRRFGELLVSAARSFARPVWQPAVDAYQTSSGWLLKYELAGVSPGDIEVVAGGRAVTVRGVRRDVRVDENQHSYSMEISYNRFERTIELPCDTSSMEIATQYRDGMLLVRLTCKEQRP